ncbi:uncharacterized protein LOC134655491 [Cydia amplana]|uniref:uncharacterized protein LOC134655491 n=1 Tax=Cydia amplana TaxID=1869771 RepID=UPI002FE65BFF
MTRSTNRILQANINHCAGAQDLLLQSMAQWSIDAAVVAEPYYVPPSHNWAADLDGLVAIITKAGVEGIPPPSTLSRGRGYVAVLWGEITLIGVYFSPNRRVSEFEAFLGQLAALVAQTQPRQVVVAGDLNAKSMAWGCPATDIRGDLLEEWATMTGMSVLNRGSASTCVRWQGESIVDVTFATPALATRVRGWRVLETVETLSDHLYIRFDVSTSSGGTTDTDRRPNGRAATPYPRWALNSLDREAVEIASLVQAWTTSPGPVETEEEAAWFREAMSQVCDAGMSRAKPRPPKRQVYWWSREIEELRSCSNRARRQYTRSRRRRHRDVEEETRLYGAYREAVKALQLSICEAKASARAELLETLNRDPWGRPYKTVRGKLRPWAPPLTESLEPRLLGVVVSNLFPNRPEHQPPEMAPPHQLAGFEGAEVGVPPVTEAELDAAVRRLKAKNTAPGPDGIPGRVLALALRSLGERFRGLLDACLQSGRFPTIWKTGRLVLLKKDGRPADSPSAYRPIVLLDEADKLFERIICCRLVEHLRGVGPDLSEHQFGFREGRSTVDAVARIKALSDEAVDHGGVLLAVSLDIANAFNTLPWSCIREALKYHKVPPYLCQIVGAYLSERCVEYPVRGGGITRWETSCGVPQGSVLGPLLWNIGYDWVLRGELLPGSSVTCYADDTLVTSRGTSYREAARLATVTVAQVVRRITMLGLEVALHKSEALCFHAARKAPPAGSSIVVGGTRIEVKSDMKYLGLVLDSRWNFREHFARLTPRLMAASAALKRLMPNIGGPDVASRRLYMGVVRSMALYGAPIWAGNLAAQNIALLRKAQRAMAISVVRGYRTTSYDAACLLAGTPPWDLEAEAQASLYEWRRELRLREFHPAPREIEAQKLLVRQSIVLQWEEQLAGREEGHRTVEAVRPVLQDWLERERGSLTFRLVQVLTGHGCFGSYLHRYARREETAECHQCGCGEDTAQHTLEECPAWEGQRRELAAVVGNDLSLPAVVKAMVADERSWKAVLSFCEDVMSQKEAAEREREASEQSRRWDAWLEGVQSRACGGAHPLKKLIMEIGNFKILRAGTQSRSLASAGESPVVYGGGKSCFVGRRDAGSREHDIGYEQTELDYASDMDILRMRGGNSEDEEERVFFPRSSLARSPVQGPVPAQANVSQHSQCVDYPSPRIDLSLPELQIPPFGGVDVLTEARDRQGRFIRRVPSATPSTATEVGARQEEPRALLALEGGREARFERVAKVLLTRIDPGILAGGGGDSDGTTYMVRSSPSPVTPPPPSRHGNPTTERQGTDVEGKAPTGNPRNRGKGKVRPRMPTPLKPAGPVPISDVETTEGEEWSGGRMWQDRPEKRPRPSDSDSMPGSSGDEGRRSTGSGGSSQASKRRGRPPTTGNYMGMAKAREAYNRALREEARLEAEKELEQMEIRTRQGFRKDTIPRPGANPEEEPGIRDLRRQVADSVAVIERVAATSKNLKGPYIRRLKDASSAITDAFAELSQRTATEETTRLQADNDRLRGEMASLRKEMAEIKAQMEAMRQQGSAASSLPGQDRSSKTVAEQSKTSAPLTKEICRVVMAQVTSYLDAHMTTIKDRLLPPSGARLAGASSKALVSPMVPAKGPSSSGSVGREKKKKPRKGSSAQEIPAPVMPGSAAAALAPAPATSTWSEVVKKGKKGKPKGAKKEVSPNTNKAPPKKARKLRLPNTSAVVLTLIPQADSSTSYAAVLNEAKSKVDIDSMGIAGVRIRRTATDARAFEIPGAASGQKADDLAAKLREVLDPALVRISRPTKCAEMRISGLDDSVLSSEVVAAVAKEGGCAEEDIKSGEVTLGPSGLGTVWLRCPIAAAKKVAQGGRVRVGWVSAQVRLLDSRPTRCFRCLEVGHVRAKCKSEVDRSLICYRCSGTGHIARDCNATAHCSLCAAAGIRADHRVGSKTCNPPKRKKTAAGGPGASTQPSPPRRPEPGVEEDRTANG